MGTNYYIKEPKKPLFHIGKSSIGWTFALHVYPELNINDIAQMIAHIEISYRDHKGILINEYDDTISYHDLLTTIARRSNPRIIKDGWDSEWWLPGHDSEESFHKANNSIRGPSGLLRRQVSEHCISHGPGTWDHCTGYFC